jgi:hypothetical protein
MLYLTILTPPPQSSFLTPVTLFSLPLYETASPNYLAKPATSSKLDTIDELTELLDFTQLEHGISTRYFSA